MTGRTPSSHEHGPARPGTGPFVSWPRTGKVKAMWSTNELERVRRHLDDLVETRCRRRLSVVEEAEYIVLCAREAQLLGLGAP